MNKILKSILRPPCRLIRLPYQFVKRIIQLWHIRNETDRLLHIPNAASQPKIFYLGITEHSNLGDLAQYYCIRKWINENYPSVNVYEFESTTVIDTHFNFMDRLSKILNPADIIFFQSGYTTQDLGGNHELMHRIIIDRFPNAKIVMMPQTIFFKSEERKQLTSKCYNQDKNLLFLARDRFSYEMACAMFPDVTVKQYPDIVTSLIGYHNYNYERNKVLFCCRDDSEKYYSDEEINRLRQKVGRLLPTDMIDTTIQVDYKEIRKKLEHYIENQIKIFAHYKLVITDRYHGTIFSLVSNTPVIVIKTNDHKVTTGVEWFHGVYDDYVFLAESLEHAYKLAETILKNEYTYHLEPYFDREYYKKLKEIIDEKYGEKRKGI
jgi:exopolysaccharide biosynthesis predicted pyruvyltransferase EpsI